MNRLDGGDPFGSLAMLPDGVVLPEITPALWDRGENVDRTLPWVLALVRASGPARLVGGQHRAGEEARQGRHPQRAAPDLHPLDATAVRRPVPHVEPQARRGRA